MKKFLKGLVLGAIVGGVIVGLATIGFNAKNSKKVTINENIIKLANGNNLIELSDGSFAIINKEKNIFEFQPVDLGDWSYELENENELNKIINNYLEIKNNGSF